MINAYITTNRNLFNFNTISTNINKFSHEFSQTTDSELIREIGNRFVDDNGDIYFTYSASESPYDANNQPWIYALKSTDGGGSWTELGKITSQGFEDPFLIKFNGEYFLYSEKKNGTTHEGINLHRGFDILNLNDQGIVVENNPNINAWDGKDRSSPVLIDNELELIMLFEGRSISGGNEGAIGKATSVDGVNWVVDTNPLIVGYNYSEAENYGMALEYVSHIVPDDITKINDLYLINSHGYNGNNFATTFLLTKDFSIFDDFLGTWVNSGLDEREYAGNGIAVFSEKSTLKALFVNNKGNDAVNPYILQEGVFSVKNGNYSRFTIKSGSFKIVPAQRSEFIEFNSSSPTTATLASDLNSGAGLVKIIKNSKNINTSITINCDTGVTINGSSSLTVLGGSEVVLISTNVNTWTVFSKSIHNLDTLNQLVPRYFSSLGTLDLNTLNTTNSIGFYSQASNANATLARNYPVELAGSFLVLNSGAGFVQIYIPYDSINNNRGFYYRNFRQSNGTWSTWKNLDNIENGISDGQIAFWNNTQKRYIPATTGMSGTYEFNALNSGEVKTMTFSNGILTGVTTL